MHALILVSAVLSTLAAGPTSTTLHEPAAPPVFRSGYSILPSVHLSDKLHLVGTDLEASRTDDAAAAGRVLLEGLLGLGLSVGGTALYGSAISTSRSIGLEAVIIPTLILTLGSTAGVGLVGSAMEREGNLGFTLLGSALGFALPLVLGVAAIEGGACSRTPLASCGAVQGAAIGMLVLPTVGAIIGFETSATGSHRHASRSSYPRRQLVPMLAPTSQGLGATVGIAGTL